MSVRVSSGKDSVQEVGTPRNLLTAVEREFGPITFDLAANMENRVTERWYGPGSTDGDDSLLMDWYRVPGLLWLNPPYKNIKAWSIKCAKESKLGARIAMLTPFALAKWSVPAWENASVRGLIPRVRFVGHTADFGKDLMISIFDPYVRATFSLWRWKQ